MLTTVKLVLAYQTQVDKLLEKDPAKKAKQFQAVIGKLGNKIERLEKNIAFYNENDHCHSCRQVIAEEVKTEYITGANAEVAEYTKAVEDAKKLMSAQEKTIAEAADFQSLIQEVQNSIFQKQTIVDSRQREITDCQNKLTELQMSSGNYRQGAGTPERAPGGPTRAEDQGTRPCHHRGRARGRSGSPEGLWYQDPDREEVPSCDEQVHP